MGKNQQFSEKKNCDRKEMGYFGKHKATGYDKTALFFNYVTPCNKQNVIASLFYPNKHRKLLK